MHYVFYYFINIIFHFNLYILFLFEIHSILFFYFTPKINAEDFQTKSQGIRWAMLKNKYILYGIIISIFGVCICFV